jgi:hypothetical protein
MPYHMLAFLCKHPSLTTDQFITYYETHHIPLIISVSGALFPTTYKRRYTYLEQSANAGSQPGVLLHCGNGMGYDCVTELVFEDRQASVKWMRMMEASEEVKRDKEVFLDRGRMLVVVVEEFATAREGK